MLKRFLPLLFVLLVAVATAVLYLALRGEGRDEPAGGPAGTVLDAGIAPDGVREFRVESEEEYQLALEALGTSNDDIEAWARSRGFPPQTYTSSPGTPLARSYRRERESVLQELADDGDIWAMQFLAARIAPDRPLEAERWYREAAVRGSAHAAFKLGGLYREVATWIGVNHDDREEVLEIARREDPLAYSSLAWLLVAEYEAGLPPGAMSATLTRFHEPDEGIVAACERAAKLLAGLAEERAERGLEAPPRRRPPLAVELPPEETEGYCDPEVFPRTDYAGCQAVRLVGEAGTVTAHRCED
jgi:hypothetical protein